MSIELKGEGESAGLYIRVCGKRRELGVLDFSFGMEYFFILGIENSFKYLKILL